jgi:hypothetical protein
MPALNSSSENCLHWFCGKSCERMESSYHSQEVQMPKPDSTDGWEAVLDMIGWAQRCWPEVQKAHQDVALYGTGFLRVTAEGIEYLPAHIVRADVAALHKPGEQP